jgi:hypothetical protein
VHFSSLVARVLQSKATRFSILVQGSTNYFQTKVEILFQKPNIGGRSENICDGKINNELFLIMQFFCENSYGKSGI